MISKNFAAGSIIHVFNKSIANYNIFINTSNSQRFRNILEYYNEADIKDSFSHFIIKNKTYKYNNLLFPKQKALVKFLSYCVMPDHYHLLLKVTIDYCLSKYISNIENSYTRYFNLKHNRKGPLWQSRYKVVKIKTNEQLLHVSRYIHLNPTTNNLVAKPEDWELSSYNDIIRNKIFLTEILNEFSISNTESYKKFVENQIDFQKKLKLIKKFIYD